MKQTTLAGHARAVETTHAEVAPSTTEIVPAAPKSVTPMALIEMAVAGHADVDKLQKLMDLQLRWEANEAKRAYIEAMTQFKTHDLPVILKSKTASFPAKGGTVSYTYAALDDVCEQLSPGLAKHGLTHRWKTEQKETKIRVTCVITHFMGHSEEEAALEASADDTGSKNPIQAMASTVTYLERYTLLAACGVAPKGVDTDAMVPFPGLDMALKAVADAPDLSALKNVSTQPIQDAMKGKHLDSARQLIEARDKRKKELTAEEPA